jgi:hypothetical protein
MWPYNYDIEEDTGIRNKRKKVERELPVKDMKDQGAKENSVLIS